LEDQPEITVLQLPKFKTEATELIGADGVEAVAVYLVNRPEAGDVVPGAAEKKDVRQIAAYLRGLH
jgi:hypothetical protein